MNFIIVTAVLLAILITVCVIVYHKSMCVPDWLSFTSIVAIVLLGLVLAIALILIPILRYDCCQKIEQFKSVKATITEQRESASELERVELTKEIIQDNAWLRSKQYQYKSSWIGVYVCEDIMDLEPIE